MLKLIFFVNFNYLYNKINEIKKMDIVYLIYINDNKL